MVWLKTTEMYSFTVLEDRVLNQVKQVGSRGKGVGSRCFISCRPVQRSSPTIMDPAEAVLEEKVLKCMTYSA